MIVVAGVSHRSASIALRERLVVPEDEIPEFLQGLVGGDVGEAMLISTCNRVELFAAAPRGDEAPPSSVASATAAALTARAPSVSRSVYVHQGADAVRHLFRVAASLDSLVLGEPQILGQVKAAFETARAAGTVGTYLNSTVPRALRAAKRVRTETSIGHGQVSVPSVAVDLAMQIFGHLRGRRVALVGSGEMAETVARLLKRSGASLDVVGRNQERVAEVARLIGGEARGWHELQSTLVEADVVITSTSARTPVIDYEMLDRARKSRRGRSLFLIDLAVPRDVQPRVDSIDGVFLYNVDDFSRVVAESAAGREREAARAEEIVGREVAGWDRWAESLHVTPTIVALRERFRGVLDAELQRSLKGKLRGLGDDDRRALGVMVEAALNKLLHRPSARLRELGTDADDAVAVLAELFGLGEPLDEEEAPDADEAASDERPAADDPEAEAVSGELSDEPRRATGTR